MPILSVAQSVSARVRGGKQMLGQTIGGRYYIIKHLGRGGFGQTYLAEDRQMPTHPRCVVKQLKPLSAKPAVLQIASRLFNKEAEVLYKLGSHDQIPRLLAHFEENQEFYLVQEFIEGHDLSGEISPGKRLSEEEVIALLRDVLQVLVFVQQHHVIHRDLKPANLIRRASDGKIVLIDFGAVKEVSTTGVNSQQPVNPTVNIGTEYYKPGEQAAGQPGFCSDIYAVGIIAIQALTGTHPSQLPKDATSGEFVWRDRVQVSEHLGKVLDKMVRYDFRDRCQSAADALQELFPPQTPKQKHQLLWKVAIGLGVAAVLAGIVISAIIIAIKEEFVTYQDANYGIKISYPKRWSIQETPDGVTGDVARFLSPKEGKADEFQENLSISVKDLSSQPRSLNEYTEESVWIIRTHSDASAPPASAATLGHRQAMEVVFAGKEGNIQVQRLEIWTVKNNKAYVITYTAERGKYSKFLPAARKMIDSFEIP
jgi:serine/threonine protein kinase